MTRKPHDSTLAGKHRTVNRVGEEHGPYRVKEYVGSDWRTSIYVRGCCRFGCGHQVTLKHDQVRLWDAHKRCGGCKRPVKEDSECRK